MRTSNITVCIPTLNRYDLLNNCITSLMTGSILPKKILVINNGTGQIKSTHPKVEYISFGKNLGVASSWNWFLENVEFPILICNDDLEFGPNDLEAFESSYNKNLGDFYYPNNISPLNMFSAFMPTPRLISTIGLFDPLLKRAYFEDNDYAYRIVLNGQMRFYAVETQINHFISGTFKALSQAEQQEHHRSFEANRDYYIKKWGGEPHKETYTEPFNGKK